MQQIVIPQVQLTFWDDIISDRERAREIRAKCERDITEYAIRISWRFTRDAYKCCVGDISTSSKLWRTIVGREKEAKEHKIRLDPAKTVPVLVVELHGKLRANGITKFPRKELARFLGLTERYLCDILTEEEGNAKRRRIDDDTEPTDEELEQIETETTND